MYLNILYQLCLLLILLPATSAHICAGDAIFDFFDTDAHIEQQAMYTNADPADVVPILIEANALCILQQDFYLRTNELNQRSLLDYGIFLPDKYFCAPWQVGAHLFYNQTTRDNYTRTSTKLCSYLAIFQETLLDELEARINEFVDTPIDLKSIVLLFAPMTVQERRTGFMIHGMRRYGPYRFRFLFPFYYNESNFFLTPEELDLIQAQLGITDPAEDMAFARRHLIADKIGFGDLRLNFDFPLSRAGGVDTKVGVQATVPTAFAIKKGLYGSSFTKMTRGPFLDFCNIFSLIAGGDFAAAQRIIETFALKGLNQFAANLIETPMGNGGHFGLGLYMRTKTKLTTLIKRPWAQHIKMRSRISAEYLFPRTQKRYFIEACDQLRFAALGLDRSTAEIIEQVENDPAYARTVLTFLEEQFTDKVFPFALDTRVQPGLIFRWMTKYMYDAPRWGYYVGTDTWLTTKEKLSKICIPDGIPPLLNTKIARKPFAYQWGVMGSVFWKVPHNWLLSLNAQYNFASTGIGKDFLLSFNFEHMF